MPKSKKNTSAKKEVSETAELGAIDDKLIEAEAPIIDEIEPALEAEEIPVEDDEELESLGENWDE
jgi:hypothetical protein